MHIHPIVIITSIREHGDTLLAAREKNVGSLRVVAQSPNDRQCMGKQKTCDRYLR